MNAFAFLSRLIPIAFFVAGALSPLVPTQAAESFRYSLSLASQQEFGRKLGFRLGLEDGAPDVPRHLDTLKLVMAVADGRARRFPKICYSRNSLF